MTKEIKKAFELANTRIGNLHFHLEDYYNATACMHQSAKKIIDEAWSMWNKQQKEHAKVAKELAAATNKINQLQAQLSSTKAELTASKKSYGALEQKHNTLREKMLRLKSKQPTQQTARPPARSKNNLTVEEQMAIMNKKAELDVQKRLHILKYTQQQKELAAKEKKKEKSDRYNQVARASSLCLTGGTGMFSVSTTKQNTNSISFILTFFFLDGQR